MIDQKLGYSPIRLEDHARRQRLLPVVSDERRDPWMIPTLITCALFLGYFGWQYLR